MASSIHRSISQPEWAKSIVHLRGALALSQVGFGDVFHCSAMTVSRWERGISEPPSHTYIEMGNFAGDPRCWYFWERAGISKNDLLRVLSAVTPAQSFPLMIATTCSISIRQA